MFDKELTISMVINKILQDITTKQNIRTILNTELNFQGAIKNYLEITFPEYFYKNSILGNSFYIVGPGNSLRNCGIIKQNKEYLYGWYFCINSDVSRAYLIHVPYIQTILQNSCKNYLEESEYRVLIDNKHVFRFEC